MLSTPQEDDEGLLDSLKPSELPIEAGLRRILVLPTRE
jgi:hypothetical protein